MQHLDYVIGRELPGIGADLSAKKKRLGILRRGLEPLVYVSVLERSEFPFGLDLRKGVLNMLSDFG